MALQYSNWQAVQKDYLAGEIDYIQAIEALMELRYSSHDAEAIVCDWDDSVQS